MEQGGAARRCVLGYHSVDVKDGAVDGAEGVGAAGATLRDGESPAGADYEEAATGVVGVDVLAPVALPGELEAESG